MLKRCANQFLTIYNLKCCCYTLRLPTEGEKEGQAHFRSVTSNQKTDFGLDSGLTRVITDGELEMSMKPRSQHVFLREERKRNEIVPHVYIMGSVTRNKMRINDNSLVGFFLLKLDHTPDFP